MGGLCPALPNSCTLERGGCAGAGVGTTYATSSGFRVELKAQMKLEEFGRPDKARCSCCAVA